MIEEKEVNTKKKKPQAKRKGIPNKMRFEVFKRDSFTCQYCGMSAPDVVLNADHVKPVKDGGKNTMLNLVTSCFDCNSGKGARRLSDDAELVIQNEELAKAQEKKSQVEMLIKWRSELSDIEDLELNTVLDAINSKQDQFTLNQNGCKIVKLLLRNNELKEVLEAVDISAEKYLVFDGPICTDSSFEDFVNKIGGICKLSGAGPFESRKHYVKGILRNRLSYFDEQSFFAGLKSYQDVDIEVIVQIAKNANTWTAFWNELESYSNA